MYKIANLSNFQYMEEGMDRGKSVREKSNFIADLLTMPAKLEEERQIAK